MTWPSNTTPETHSGSDGEEKPTGRRWGRLVSESKTLVEQREVSCRHLIVKGDLCPPEVKILFVWLAVHEGWPLLGSILLQNTQKHTKTTYVHKLLN